MSDKELARTFAPEVHASLAELRQIARDAKSRDDPRLRKATPEEVALAVTLRKAWACRGSSTRTGLPCTKAKVTGLAFCRKHSAALPRMKEKAAQRLAALSDPAVAMLEHAINQRDNLLVGVKAAADVLDRNGIGALVESKVRAAAKDGERIIVNIGFLGGLNGAPTTIEVTPKPGARLVDAKDE